MRTIAFLKKVWRWMRKDTWEAKHFDYAPGDPIGYGCTAEEAKADLLNKVEEKYDEIYRATTELQYPAHLDRADLVRRAITFPCNSS
jgi:hypothetical protein